MLYKKRLGANDARQPASHQGVASSLGTLERQWDERLDSLAWIYAANSMRSRGERTLIDSFANIELFPTVTHSIERLAMRARFVQESIFPRVSWRQSSKRPRNFSFPTGIGREEFEPPPLPSTWGDFSPAFRFRSNSRV